MQHYQCLCAGELSGPGAELLIRFHTSPEEKKRYTILTHGQTDMIVALLGMLQVKNSYTSCANIVQVLMTTQGLSQLAMMMLVMARMLGLFVGSLQTETTSYRYKPFILKEENLNSQSLHGDTLKIL